MRAGSLEDFLAEAKSMGAGAADYFSAMASALAAHPRKAETAAESSGSPLKRGEDLQAKEKRGEKGQRRGENG